MTDASGREMREDRDDEDPGHYVDAEHDAEPDVSQDEDGTGSYVDAELDDVDVDADPESGHYVDAERDDEDVDHEPETGRYVDIDPGPDG